MVSPHGGRGRLRGASLAEHARERDYTIIARIEDPDATSYDDHDVIESSDYYYQVRAYNSAGTGPASLNKCGFLDRVYAAGSQGLAYPGDVDAALTENGTAVLLTWTEPTTGYHGQDVSPANGYQILRWDVKRGYANWDVLVDNTRSTATSYVDRNIAPNNEYDYKVRAWNDWGVGERSFSGTVKTGDLDVIGAPQNFRVSSSAEGALLTWEAPEDAAGTEVSYRIYRRDHSGATVPMVLLASAHSATSYTDGTVAPGAEYHYQVRVDGDPLGSRHGAPTDIGQGFYRAPSDLVPMLSVVAVATHVSEEEPAKFKVTRTGPATEKLTVKLRWTWSDRTKDLIQPLALPAGRSTGNPRTQRPDDDVVSEDRTVTLTVEDGAGYRVSGSARSAEVVVEDNDEAEFALSLEPAQMAEGESATIRVEVTNDVTFEDGQTIALDFAGSTATKGTDYTVSSESLTLGAGESVATATVTAEHDTEEESDEEVSVTASHGGASIGTATARITDEGPVNTAATVPRITAVQVTSVPELERDTYGRGERIRFTVEFSEKVEVTGSPHFTFSLGNRGATRKVDAAYESGSGTAALVFGYMVQEGDEDNNGIFLVDGDALGRAGPVALEAGEAITALGGGLAADLSSSVRGTQRGHKVDGSRALDAPRPPDEGRTNTAAAGAPTISGTPQVGEELTASTSGISDADGLENASFDYQWIRARGDIRGATGSTYTAVDADEGERLKVRVSFTDDVGNAESLTSAATDAVAVRPEPLTASFEDVPAAHDGESAFTLRIASSDRLSMMNGRRLREDVVAVSGGRATSAGRVNRRRDLWRLTVEPDSLADVTVTLAAGAACDSPAAVCTKDGRALSNTISATVRGPVGISVADAHVEEDAGAVLAFAVTLSRAASRALTVDYATSDGSAQAGVDYTAASGTLTFQAGESSKTVEVGVLDDAHDEGEETLTLTLSSASGGLLTDGEATGTIENRDPLPRALLARFGRTAAVHVVEHVEERLQAPRQRGFRGRFAGRELRPGMERDMALGFLQQFGGAAGGHPAGMARYGAMGGSPAVGAGRRWGRRGAAEAAR